MPARLPSGRELRGGNLSLRVLTDADADELGLLLTDVRAYAQGYAMHRIPSTPADGAALARERWLSGRDGPDGRGGGRLAYAVRLVADGPLGGAGTLVGTSSLAEAHLADEKVHLGSTFYGPQFWGSTVNPQAKLLLLGHCFDHCGYGRVKLQTDVLNIRSTAAIARLGAVKEGVIRRDVRREDGSFRDSVVFSILADEWPTVRAGLEQRLR